MSRDPRGADIAVVGGGPAAAICGIELARGGARATLVHHADYQVGGIELVSGRARRLIEQRCPDFFQRVAPGVEVHETISLWGTQEPVTWNAMCNPWGPGVAVERSVLDRALRRLACDAGVSIAADARVSNADRLGDRWRLSLRRGETVSTMSADFLVIATGRAGGGFLGRASVAEPPQIVLMSRLRAQSAEQGYAFYLEAMDNRWFYALPDRERGHFVGLCIGQDEVMRRRTPLREFFVRELRRTRLLGPMFSNVVVDQQVRGRSAGARVFDRTAGESWIAIGDAAYAPDPLSGMGIEMAIESAQLGARALLAAPGAHALVDYEEWIADHARRHKKLGAGYRATAGSWTT